RASASSSNTPRSPYDAFVSGRGFAIKHTPIGLYNAYGLSLPDRTHARPGFALAIRRCTLDMRIRSLLHDHAGTLGAARPKRLADHLWILHHIEQRHGIVGACQRPIAAGRVRFKIDMYLAGERLVGEHRRPYNRPIQPAHLDHALGPGKVGVGFTK